MDRCQRNLKDPHLSSRGPYLPPKPRKIAETVRGGPGDLVSRFISRVIKITLLITDLLSPLRLQVTLNPPLYRTLIDRF